MKLVVTRKMTNEMYKQLERAVAMYELLHAHAKGQTCLTEDQLANAVTGISLSAKDTLRRARGGRPLVLDHKPIKLSARASRWARTPRGVRHQYYLDS